MHTLTGPDASIAVMSLSSATSPSLSAAFTNADPPATTTTTAATSDSTSPVAAQVECYEQGALAVMQTGNIPHERVCLLDPKASLALTPSHGDAIYMVPLWDYQGNLGTYLHTRANKEPSGGTRCARRSLCFDGTPDDGEQSTTLHGAVSQSFPRSVSQRVIWSRADDNRHGPRRDEARHRQSRFVFPFLNPQQLAHYAPGG